MNLLPPDGGALIAQDLIPEGGGQVVEVGVGARPGDDHILALSSQQVADDRVGLRGGGGDDARVIAQTHPEHQEVEGLVSTLPRSELVEPPAVELRPTESLGLLGCDAFDRRAVDHLDLDLGAVVGLDQRWGDAVDQARLALEADACEIAVGGG